MLQEKIVSMNKALKTEFCLRLQQPDAEDLRNQEEIKALGLTKRDVKIRRLNVAINYIKTADISLNIY